MFPLRRFGVREFDPQLRDCRLECVQLCDDDIITLDGVQTARVCVVAKVQYEWSRAAPALAPPRPAARLWLPLSVSGPQGPSHRVHKK